MAEKGVSAKIVSIGIIVGLLISFIGLTTIAATSITEKSPTEETIKTARETNRSALVVWFVGMLILSIFMFLGAVDSDLSDYAKLGLLIALGLMLAATTWLVTKIGGLLTPVY
ncbi:MAG: hypothetical protein QMC80_09120 [Thermoplasmatales archaeon]|nr:hypothetical protein [Thermoplasmatales archaeon]